MDEKMPLRKASNPTPDFRRQHSSPITLELARQKREGVGLVFSTAIARFFPPASSSPRPPPRHFPSSCSYKFCHRSLKKFVKIKK